MGAIAVTPSIVAANAKRPNPFDASSNKLIRWSPRSIKRCISRESHTSSSGDIIIAKTLKKMTANYFPLFTTWSCSYCPFVAAKRVVAIDLRLNWALSPSFSRVYCFWVSYIPCDDFDHNTPNYRCSGQYQTTLSPFHHDTVGLGVLANN